MLYNSSLIDFIYWHVCLLLHFSFLLIFIVTALFGCQTAQANYSCLVMCAQFVMKKVQMRDKKLVPKKKDSELRKRDMKRNWQRGSNESLICSYRTRFTVSRVLFIRHRCGANIHNRNTTTKNHTMKTRKKAWKSCNRRFYLCEIFVVDFIID